MDDDRVEEIVPPQEYLVPAREFVSSDVEALRNTIAKKEQEIRRLIADLNEAREILKKRAVADAQRHAQREKVVAVQQRQLFGAVRRMQWLLKDRDRLARLNEQRKRYIVKLERRVLELMSNKSMAAIARPKAVPTLSSTATVARDRPKEITISVPSTAKELLTRDREFQVDVSQLGLRSNDGDMAAEPVGVSESEDKDRDRELKEIEEFAKKLEQSLKL
jgi:hypothetical protein